MKGVEKIPKQLNTWNHCCVGTFSAVFEIDEDGNRARGGQRVEEVFAHNHMCSRREVVKTHNVLPIAARGNPPKPIDYDNYPVLLKEGQFDLMLGLEIPRLLKIIGEEGFDATESPFHKDNTGMTHNPFTDMSVLSLPCTSFGSKLVRTAPLLVSHTVSLFLFVCSLFLFTATSNGVPLFAEIN